LLCFSLRDSPPAATPAYALGDAPRRAPWRSTVYRRRAGHLSGQATDLPERGPGAARAPRWSPVPDREDLSVAPTPHGAVSGRRLHTGDVHPWNLLLRPHRTVSEQQRKADSSSAPVLDTVGSACAFDWALSDRGAGGRCAFGFSVGVRRFRTGRRPAVTALRRHGRPTPVAGAFQQRSHAVCLPTGVWHAGRVG